MRLKRRDRYLLRIEHQRLGTWEKSGSEWWMRHKPVVSEALAATGYVIFVGEYLRYPQGRWPSGYRTALYKVRRSGRKKLVWSCSMPPPGWGTTGYSPVEWPSGKPTRW